MRYDPKCRRCPLSEGPRAAGAKVCVPGYGRVPADVMYVGEAPAAAEEKEGRPFVGQAGRELDDCLARAGIRRQDIFIGNSVRCRLVDGHKPNAAELEACRYFTVEELTEVRPKVILALGGTALKALTGKSGIKENRGKLLPLLQQFRSDVRVIPTYHPASWLHNAANREAFSKALVEDMQLAERTARPLPTNEVKIQTATDKKARQVLKAIYKANVPVAVDLEWEVLKPRDRPEGWYPWSKRGNRSPKVLCISFAARVNGTVYATAMRFNEANHKAIATVLANRKIILFSGGGDLIWLYHLKFRVNLAHDVHLLAGLANMDTSLALNALAALLTDMPPDWKRDTEVTIGTAPRTEEQWRALLIRAAQDAAATLLLYEHKDIRGINSQARRLYTHVLLPALQQLAQASLNGFPMDADMLAKLDESALINIRKHRQVAADLMGLGENHAEVFTSDAKLGPAIEATLHVKFPRTAKTDRPSVTKGTLSALEEKHSKLITPIKKQRHLTTLKTNYLDPWQGLLSLQGDGLLHTMYRLSSAATGRTSAFAEAGATFQQFPREKVFKRAMRAPDGHKILSADQSTIEMRMAAWLSREPRMLQFLRDGTDMHKATAGFIKALKDGYTMEKYLPEMEAWMADVTDEERTSAKVFNFGLLFGGTWRVIIELGRTDYGLYLTEAQAKEGERGFHILFPKLREWHETFRPLLGQGYVDLPTGRRRTVMGLEFEDDEGKMRKLINAGPQGIASDLALFCADVTMERTQDVLAEYTNEAVKYIGFFHDAGLWVVRDDAVELMRHLVQDTWDTPPLERLGLVIDVPLQADVGVGQTWEDALADADKDA